MNLSVDLSALSPLRQQCALLSIGHMPDWNVWRTLEEYEQDFLSEVLFELNDMPTVLGHFEFVVESRMHMMRQLQKTDYIFPSSIKLEDWQRFEALQLEETDRGVFYALGILIRSAVKHQRPELLEWLQRSPTYETNKTHINHYLWDALKTITGDECSVMGTPLIIMLKEMGGTDKVLKQQAPKAYQAYERHLIESSVALDKPNRNPKVM